MPETFQPSAGEQGGVLLGKDTKPPRVLRQPHIPLALRNPVIEGTPAVRYIDYEAILEFVS